MALENTAIQDKLVATFGEAVYNFQQERDIFL
jgi:NADH-quinone oxidoreductase subunit C